MARPKGSKNKPPTPEQITAKGDPRFNLKDAKPVDPKWMAAPTDEDLALDRELERMASSEAPQLSDIEPPPMKKMSVPFTLLSESMDVKPAGTLAELDDQIWLAKKNDADSVECTDAMFKYFTRGGGDPNNVGYFHYKDIKVYRSGFFEQSKAKAFDTIEQRVFGLPKDRTP